MTDDIPFISQRSVQQVLDAMLHGGQSKQASPLENLILVENILSDPTMPSMEQASSFALHKLLIDIIQQEFVGQCRIFGLDVPEVRRETRSQAIENIRQIAQVQAPELSGWMLLYYRYVRADLSITLSDLLEAFSVETRTLRRYQVSAIKTLTNSLSFREWEARREKHQRYLYSLLPASVSERLWGRDGLLAHIRSVIANDTAVHFLITGAEGVGKTSFVHALVRELIDNEIIDQLVWLTRPGSADFVNSHLEQVLLRDLRLSLKEYSLLNQLAVVMDDASLLDDSLESYNLFKELSNAIVIVTNTMYRPLGSQFSHIVLPELDRDTVAAIVMAARPALEHDSSDALDIFVADLWDRVGGNPMAVKLAANNLTNIDLRQPLFAGDEVDLAFRMLGSAYDAVSQGAQTILLMLALLPAEPVARAFLSALWADFNVVDDDLLALLSCGLIVSASDTAGYLLPDISRRFIEWQCSHSKIVQERSITLIEHLENSVSESRHVDVVEHILSQEWLEIDTHHKLSLVESAIEGGLWHGRYAVWTSVLGRLMPISDSMNLKYYYAICLRQTSKFSQSEGYFREIIDYFGRTGDFYQQGRGLLEFGILLRQQGFYERAAAMFERARSIMAKRGDEVFLRKIDLEIAQTLLDSGETDTLRTLVDDILAYNIDDAKAMILLSEILLHAGDYERAASYAAIAENNCDGSNRGRVCAILGRIAAEQEDFENAQDWFDLAVSLLEQESDWYGLARAKSNLAAAFLQQRQYIDDAEILLTQAMHTQEILNDRMGLIYTTHNMEILMTAKWIDET